jgi:uncharacterized protein (TIGR03000 family)
MYSVILMAAMTANTAEVPAFHRVACGCCGGLYLHGAGYGSCMGCWGGCYGCYGGCWGGCHGCWGYGYYSGGCYGCMGCYGSWFGYGDNAMPAVPTYPSGNPMTAPPGTTAPPATPPAGTPPAGATPPTTPPTTPPGGAGAPAKPMGARLIIEKPADARLYVDDRPVKSDGAVETFATPGLDPARAYYYMVRVEMVRDGKPVSEIRRVVVRSGQTITESFNGANIATVPAAGGFKVAADR